jgi:hypothetical protein
MTTTEELDAALAGVVRSGWLDAARARVAAESQTVAALFAAAGRHCGREPLPGLAGWRADDAARVLLLAALPLRGDALAAAVQRLYRHGDAHEKRAVLSALPSLELPEDAARALLHDAIRTNDTRLLRTALGPAAAQLDDAMWRQGVVKCVFAGVPLRHVADLDNRADAELLAMLDGLIRERRAAGRSLPQDALALLNRCDARKEN